MKYIKSLKKYVFACLLLLLGYKSAAQQNTATKNVDSATLKVIVLPQMKNSVDSLMHTLDGKEDPVNDFAVNYVYENDSLVSITEETGQKFTETRAIDAICTGDTLTLLINAGFTYGGAVQIIIAKDKYMSDYITFTNGDNILKYQGDRVYASSIDVNATRSKLILNHMPTCKNGDEVYGELDAKFAAFYRKTGSTDRSIKIQWRAIFKGTFSANEATKIGTLKQ